MYCENCRNEKQDLWQTERGTKYETSELKKGIVEMQHFGDDIVSEPQLHCRADMCPTHGSVPRQYVRHDAHVPRVCLWVVVFTSGSPSFSRRRHAWLRSYNYIKSERFK